MLVVAVIVVLVARRFFLVLRGCWQLNSQQRWNHKLQQLCGWLMEAAPTTTGAICGTLLEPLAHHALLCSRAQMSWRHDAIAEARQGTCRNLGLSAHLKQKAVEFLATSRESLMSTVAALRETLQCTWTWW